MCIKIIIIINTNKKRQITITQKWTNDHPVIIHYENKVNIQFQLKQLSGYWMEVISYPFLIDAFVIIYGGWTQSQL